ncbi:MAG TPA: hypothetical protein VNL13_07940 [Sulfolobales archaeon]|nr:hypothetical protein [Sulfolobales archaeon]
MDPKIWAEDWERAFRRMNSDLYIGYLDHGIRDLLIDIFNLKDYYPTSSCTGRIIAIDAPAPWKRKESYIVFKKHTEISREDLERLLNIPVISILWVIASGPIIHIMARTPKHAMIILKKVREAGFKHSGLIASSKRGYLVELVTGIWIGIPVKDPVRVLISRNEIEGVVLLLNRALAEGKARLESLRKAIKGLKV